MADPASAPTRVFVDTGAWFDYFVTSDDAAPEVRRWIEKEGLFLVTSSFVFDELLTLLQARIHHTAAVKAGELLRDSSVTHLERVTADDETLAWHRFRDRPSKGYSFTDCTSFVVMDRLGTEQVLSTDSDFTRAGFTNLLTMEE